MKIEKYVKLIFISNKRIVQFQMKKKLTKRNM